MLSKIERPSDKQTNKQKINKSKLASSCSCFQSPTSATFITSHLIWFATCGHEHTVERKLAISFSNHPCHSGGSHHPSARLWSSSLFVVFVELLLHRAGSLLSLLASLYKSGWQSHRAPNCSSSEPQTMSHIVDSCLQTKFVGALTIIYDAEEDAVNWLNLVALSYLAALLFKIHI